MEEPAQPGRSVRRSSRSRRCLWWLAAWTVLTGSGLLVHYLVWKIGTGSPRPTLLHSTGNALHVLTAPGWAVVRVTFGGWSVSSWAGPATAIGIGCAVWVAAAWLYLALRGRARGRRAAAVPNAARRRFLTDAPAAAAGLTGAGLLVQSAFVEPWALTFRSYRIPIDGLPAALDGLRLVQISDTHLGPRIPASFIRSAVDRALALKPDAFLLTGDYIHNGAAYIAPAAELFRPLVATGRPVVGVLGNHDWYGGGREMSRALAVIGVRMIDNGRVWLDAASRGVVTDRPRGDALCVAGVGDLLQDTVDFEAALGGVPDPVPRLLLSHNPDVAEMRIGHRVDLMISGHTHGGQVRLPLLGTPIVPSRYADKYSGGLVRGPAFPVLVSRGVGMSILPVRLGVPPELVELTLTRA